MSIDSNKDIARRYFEDIWNRHDLAAVDALVAPEVRGHVAGTDLQGRAALRQRLEATHQVYAEPRFTVEDQVAEGDRVAVRWTFTGRQVGAFMGVAPSGRTVRVTGLSLFRLAAGQIAEVWLNADDLGELQQLGVLPAPQAARTP
ncbi:MAG: ester cyclase [Anaerolineales bacterium]|nr:ester cyclase [Anaerolineales bacterium]